MLDLIAAPGDVFSPDRYRPGHFTASAIVLSPEGSALLLVFHQKLRRWLQPGGHVDPVDPDIFAAARREVAEETGVQTVSALRELSGAGGRRAASPEVLDLDVHRIPARAAEPAHEHFDVRFLMWATGTAAKAGSDAEAVRWVPLSEMASVNTDESVRRVVDKLVRRRAGV
jgi:8-oxo-dGTP pyrophosphatase MutT (NUDIX family)